MRMMQRNPGARPRTCAAAAAAFALLIAACTRDAPPRRVECDPGRAVCIAETPLGRIELDIAPRPVPVLKPVQFDLATSTPLDEVRIELQGRDMDMGPNQTRLIERAPQRWQGSATIPVCLTGRMRWDATVSLRRGERVERLSFGFEAG